MIWYILVDNIYQVYYKLFGHILIFEFFFLLEIY